MNTIGDMQNEKYFYDYCKKSLNIIKIIQNNEILIHL